MEKEKIKNSTIYNDVKENMENKEQSLKKIIKNIIKRPKLIFIFFCIFLCSLLVLYVIYLLQKLIYFIINSFLYFTLSYIFNNNCISYLSVGIQIYLHYLLIRVIILSIVFIGGGLLKKYVLYINFYNYIIRILSICEQLFKLIDFNDNNDDDIDHILYFMKEIQIFHKVYNQQKLNKVTFETYVILSENLNNICFIFDKLRETNYKDKKLKIEYKSSLRLFKNDLEFYENMGFLRFLLGVNSKSVLTYFREISLINFYPYSASLIPLGNSILAFLLKKENNYTDNNNDSDKFVYSNNCYNTNINVNNNSNHLFNNNNDNNNKYTNNSNNLNTKTLAVFCGQNAFCYEFLAVSKENIKAYIEFSCDNILLFNYQGYGLRPGFPSFKNIEKDCESIVNFILSTYPSHKIIIHGTSIGGYAAIKLSKKLKNRHKNDVFLISDRTYSSIENFPLEMSIRFGEILRKTFLFFLPRYRYKGDNVQDYIDFPYDKKAILVDLNDEVIMYKDVSLTYGVCKEYFERELKKKLISFPEYKSISKYGKSENFISEILKLSLSSYEEDANYLINNLLFDLTNNRFKDFIMFFLIFGYPFNFLRILPYNENDIKEIYQNVPLILRNIYVKNKYAFSENFTQFLRKLNLLFVLTNLNTKLTKENICNFNYDGNDNFFTMKKEQMQQLRKYFGTVHPLNCGHNGNFRKHDIKFIHNFIKDNESVN